MEKEGLKFQPSPYVVVNIGLLENAYANGMTESVRLHALLRHHFHGEIQSMEGLMKHLQAKTEFGSIKSVRKHFNNLVELEWVSFDPHKNRYKIRSQEKVLRILGIESSTSVRWFFQGSLSKKEFGVFIFSAIVGQMVRYAKFQVKNGGSLMEGPKYFFDFFLKHKYIGLSAKAIANKIRRDVSIVSKNKTAASKAGFLEINKKFEIIQNLTPKELRQMRKLDAEAVIGMRILKNGRVGLQLPDEIIPKLEFVRRKINFQPGQKLHPNNLEF